MKCYLLNFNQAGFLGGNIALNFSVFRRSLFTPKTACHYFICHNFISTFCLKSCTVFNNLYSSYTKRAAMDAQPHINETSNGETGAKKRLSVERIYQKKTQLEHILLRPDSYIGSTLKNTHPMWIMDDEKQCMISKDLTFSPGLYKIFDEILGWFLFLINFFS